MANIVAGSAPQRQFGKRIPLNRIAIRPKPPGRRASSGNNVEVLKRGDPAATANTKREDLVFIIIFTYYRFLAAWRNRFAKAQAAQISLSMTPEATLS